ncbi:MAG: hypothetical protein ACK5JC_01920 [Bacteroidota bacterium]|jgi:hypothetical protein
MSDFCKGNTYKKVAAILSNHLFGQLVNIESMYEKMIDDYNNPNPENLNFYTASKEDIIGYGDLLKLKRLQNVGIDLPIYFGDNTLSKRIMIVAMDAKRNGQNDDKITIGSVFSLNYKNSRSTKSNDYWKFIEPLTKNSFVYLTDIFKIYYETTPLADGKQSIVLSNKDKDYTGKESIAFKTNRAILEAEINLVKPDTIISLGNESAAALKMLSGIYSNDIDLMHNDIRYLFMPHISRTVTQSISTIANLFIAMGKLKNNHSMIDLGQQIKLAKDKLYSYG